MTSAPETKFLSPSEAEALRKQLATTISALGEGLIERDEVLRGCVLAALAGEHALLLGPPGTAKSMLAKRVRHLFKDARYFERLLTRFSVPEELFGPLSLSALEADRYERKTAGYLPAVEVAFIDEVFKANSAILNSLLTLLNEREFDNGTQRFSAPLISVIGASNEVPDDQALAPIYDRFLVRIKVDAVSADGFNALLLASEAVSLSAAPLSLERAAALRASAAQISVHADALRLLGNLRGRLIELGANVSDRRWRKSLHLMRVAALTSGRTEVIDWDACILPWTLASPQCDTDKVEELVSNALGIVADYEPVQLRRAIEALRGQLDIDESATELAFDDSGKLSFSVDAAAREEMTGAPRLSSALRRRVYGAHFIEGRALQATALLAMIDTYLPELAAKEAVLQTVAETHLWMTSRFVARTRDAFARARTHARTCREDAMALQMRIASLPREETASAEPREHPQRAYAAG